jgi:tetratricopeptide (TPR) repeat protein
MAAREVSSVNPWEGDAMVEARVGSRVGFFGLLAAGVVVLAGGLAGRADDKKPAKADEAMRAELLKLNTVTGEDALTARLRGLVKDKAKGKAAVAEAAAMLREAKKDPPFNLNAALLLGQAAYRLRDYDSAEVIYNRAVEASTKLNSGAKMVQSYLGLTAAQLAAKKYVAAMEVCQKVVEMKDAPDEFEPAQLEFISRLIKAKTLAGLADDMLKDYVDEATKSVEDLCRLPNEGWLFYDLKAWVQHETGKPDAAIKTYNELLDKIDALPKLKAEQKEREKDEVRHQLSNLYIEVGNLDAATKQLEILMKHYPENATYKNDLGYVWADQNVKLDEAEKLIREALEMDRKAQEKLKAEGVLDEVKDNAAYVDSLGWVQFRKKQYEEALKHLKQAAEDEEGQHMEIWDHLADCQLALGQKKEAVATWEKALKMDDMSKRDAERRRKVTEKLRKTRAELKQ